MDGCFHPDFPFSQCKCSLKPLAFFWVCGLLFGAVLAISADNLLTSTMRAAVHSGMSIFGLLAAMLLPLYLSAYAVYASQRWMLVLIAFCKACFFSFISAGILLLYPTAGWLLRLLLMCGQIGMIPLLWWFWCQPESDNQSVLIRRTAICTLFAVGICCADVLLIGPFLARLIYLGR